VKKYITVFIYFKINIRIIIHLFIIMSTKEELVSNIKEWMKVESDMKALQKNLKECRARKKSLADGLVTIMKTNEIDCFDLSEGKLLYTKTKVKAPVNKKHLMVCLEKYFSQDSNINTDEVCNYILENRSVKENESIRHKPNKNI